jgi:DNA-binding response OmpR family regulator
MQETHCPNCGCRLQKFEPMEYGNVRIDGLSDIEFEGRAVILARTQRRLVESLIQARGRYLTRGVLATILEGDINDSTICKYVERARSAFLAINPAFDQIECLRGFSAYRWRFCAGRLSQFDARRPKLNAGSSAATATGRHV